MLFVYLITVVSASSYFSQPPEVSLTIGYAEETIRRRIDEILRPVRDVEARPAGLISEDIPILESAIDDLRAFEGILRPQKKDCSKLLTHLARLEKQLAQLVVQRMRHECTMTPAQLERLDRDEMLRFEGVLKRHQQRLAELHTGLLGSRTRGLIDSAKMFVAVILDRIIQLDPVRQLRMKVAEYDRLMTRFEDTPEDWTTLTRLVASLSRRSRTRLPAEAKTIIDGIHRRFVENKDFFQLWSMRNVEDVLPENSEGTGLALIVNQESALVRLGALFLLPPITRQKLHDVYMIIETSRIVQNVATAHYGNASAELARVAADLRRLEAAADAVPSEDL